MKVSIVVQFHNGIGHLARISAIARALTRFAEVTIFSGGRPVEFQLAEKLKFVQLPAVHWNAEEGGCLRPVNPGMSLDECLSERSRILIEAYRNSPPDIVITEFFPFSPELYGATLDGLLDEIRQSNPRPLLFCSIRAFPRFTKLDADAPAEWIRGRLSADYSGVFHHVDSEIFPLSSLGDYLNMALAGIPVYQTGFVRKPVAAPHKECGQGILMTVGGGNANSALLLKKWIEAVDLLPEALHPVHAVCGPLMPDGDRTMLRKIAGDRVILHDRVPDMDVLMQECCAVVCMGGYNTLIEALSLKKPVLSFPSGTYEDQHFQIRRFAECGLLMRGEPSWTPREIAEAIELLLDFVPARPLLACGAEKTADWLKEFWQSTRELSSNPS